MNVDQRADGSTTPCVLVTGTASGIGRATVQILLAGHHRVLAWDIDEQGVHSLRDSLEDDQRGLLHTSTVNALDRDQVREALSAYSTADYPHALINCAGPSSLVERSFDDGLLATINSMRIPTEEWLEAGPLPDGSPVVHVASIAGAIIAGDGPSWYAAGKAAIVGYSRALAGHRPHGIRSNVVAPGIVDTPRTQEFLRSQAARRILDRNPMGAPATANDVAAILVFAVSPAAAYLNGVVIPVDGGLTIT